MESIINALKTNNVKEFLQIISSLLPSSDDVSITLVKIGTQEYVLDRNGVSVITTSLDEFLPFLSAKEKRLEYMQIPNSVKEKILSNYKDILKQLYDILLNYSKRDKRYSEIASKLGEFLNENK